MFATPTEFLAANLSQQVVRPNPSSWGENGFNSVWLSEENAWIYRHLHGATRRMIEIARAQPEPVALLSDRALRQAARELLLAQSSDWAFLMKNQTAPQYAEARTREHLLRFNRLYEQLRVGSVDSIFLGECEARTPLFPNLDWRYYL